MQLFLGDAPEAVTIAQHIAWLATWGFVAFGVTMVLFAAVRANGQVLWPLAILFVSMFPVRLGFAYGLRGWLGVDALWLSFPVAMLATMIMAILLYRFGNWRREHDMQVPPAAAAPDALPPAATLFTEAVPPGSPTAANAPPLHRQ